jgi:hypothetical protein
MAQGEAHAPLARLLLRRSAGFGIAGGRVYTVVVHLKKTQPGLRPGPKR